MKFPITREELQAYNYVKDQEEQLEQKIQDSISKLIDQLCEEFKQSMKFNKDKKYVWNKFTSIKPYINGRDGLDKYLPQIIDKLKNIFIDCNIIIDPLHTYIIIDWS